MRAILLAVVFSILILPNASGAQITETSLNKTLEGYLYSDEYKDQLEKIVDGKVDEGLMDQQAWFTETFLPQYEIIMNLTQNVAERDQKIITLEDRMNRQTERLETKDKVIEAQKSVINRLKWLVYLSMGIILMIIFNEMGAFQTLKQSLGGMKEKWGP
jgi:hypothetical protein